MTFCRNNECNFNSVKVHNLKEKMKELNIGAAGHCERNDIMLDDDGNCMSRDQNKDDKSKLINL